MKINKDAQGNIGHTNFIFSCFWNWVICIVLKQFIAIKTDVESGVIRQKLWT